MPEDFDPTGTPLADPFEPASSLPGARHTGGAMPTQTGMVEEMLARQNANQLATHVLMNSGRSRALAGMTARALAGKNAEQWLQTDNGKLAQLSIGGMLNSNMLQGYTGGSDLNLAFGMQNAIGRGMRATYGGSQQMFSGRGFMNDLVTEKLFDRVQDQFYGPAGAARLQHTGGFDRNQIGQMFSELGNRGAFTGMNIGELKQAADGKSEFVLDDGVASKIGNLATQALKTVRTLTNITGNKDIRAMMDLAEKVTGGEFVSDPGMINRKIQEITRTAAVLGENPQAMLQRIAARGGGPAATIAVTAAASSFQSSLEQRRQMLANGQYIAAPRQGEIEAVNNAGMNAIQAEEKEGMAALYVSQHYRISDEQKKGIQDRMNAINAGQTLEAKAAARAQLRSYVEPMTGGVPLATLFDQQGGSAGINAALDEKNRGFGAEWARREDMSRLFGMNMRELSISTRLDKVAGTRFGTMEKSMSSIFGKMDRKSETDLLAALEKGDMGEAHKIFGTASGFADEAARQSAWSSLEATVGQSSAQQVGKALGIARDSMANNPMFRNRESDGDRDNTRNQSLRRRIDERRFGTGVAENDLLGGVIRGWVGGENIGDTQILQYAENKKDPSLVRLKMNNDGTGLQELTDEQLAQLQTLPGLSEAMGGDIRKGLQAPKGMESLLSYFDDKGFSWQTGGDNVLRALDGEHVKSSEKRLSDAASKNLLHKITGIGSDELDTMSNDPTKLGALLTQHSDKIIAGIADPKSEAAEDNKALAGQNKELYMSALDVMISKRQETVDYATAHPIASHFFLGKVEAGKELST